MESAKFYNYEEFQLHSPIYCPVGGGILIQSSEHMDDDGVVEEAFDVEEEFQQEEDYNLWFEDYS